MKTNLLYIVDSLKIGGAEKQVVTLLKTIDREKFNVSLCSLQKDGPLEKEIEGEPVNFISLRMRRRSLIIVLFRLIDFIKKNNIQIVHTHLYTSNLWGRIAALISGVPVIISTEHGRGLWRKWHHLLFERMANRFTDLRIAVSDDVRRIRIQREHTPPEKVVTIQNAINADEFIVPADVHERKREEFGLKQEDMIIGTVARFDPDKALDLLLDASAEVMKSRSNVRVLLVGDGPLRGYLEDHARNLGIADGVIFTGIRSDIAELLNVMDVYVNSSIREGIPVSLLEAMAAERACVATNVGGNAEVINDVQCGIIVPSKDAKALTDGINTLLDNKPLRERVASAARERVLESFSIKAHAKKMESIYEELLSASRKDTN